MSDDFGATWDAHEVKQQMDSSRESEQAAAQAEADLRQSEQGAQQSAAALQSEAANLATATAALNESAERAARIFDSESDGAASDYRAYERAAEDHAVNINQSVDYVAKATSEDEVTPQLDYIPGEVEQLKTSADGMEGLHNRAPDRVKQETSDLPEQATIVRSLCTSLDAAVETVRAWYADVTWKRQVLAESRARHLEEIQAEGLQEIAGGQMPDYGDGENVYADTQRLMDWSREDDATIAAARARQREDM